MSKKIIILIICIMLVGCVQEKRVPPQKPQNMMILFGLDETGSFELWDQAKGKVCGIIQELLPGDIIYIRRITDRSYHDSAIIFTLELPLIDDENINPFDVKFKQRRKAQLHQVRSFKNEGCTRLAESKFAKAPNTDIIGFLSAAAERFSRASKNYKKVLIIATDLADNVRRKAEYPLLNVDVIVSIFQASDDPGKSQALKSLWEKRFKDAGSSSVTFLSVDEKFNVSMIRGH